jgi:hypothetical protein
LKQPEAIQSSENQFAPIAPTLAALREGKSHSKLILTVNAYPL